MPTAMREDVRQDAATSESDARFAAVRWASPVAINSVVHEPRLAVQLGATACLQKPVDRGTLEATIGRFVVGAAATGGALFPR